MKTSVIVVLVVLFLLSISYYFSCKDKCKSKISEKGKDKRVESIKRAKKNLHPVINRNVDRDSNGRFVKREV